MHLSELLNSYGYDKTKDFKKIDVSSCEEMGSLTSLNKFSFKDWEVKTLILAGNYEFDGNFRNFELGMIETLDLSNMNLDLLDCLSIPNSLKSLNLSGNYNIDLKKHNFNKVEELYLKRCGLRSIKNNLEKVRNLYLSENCISEIDLSFSNLVKADLSHNKIKDLKRITFSDLMCLDLSSNDIKKLNGFESKKLKVLNLLDNEILDLITFDPKDIKVIGIDELTKDLDRFKKNYPQIEYRHSFFMIENLNI